MNAYETTLETFEAIFVPATIEDLLMTHDAFAELRAAMSSANTPNEMESAFQMMRDALPVASKMALDKYLQFVEIIKDKNHEAHEAICGFFFHVALSKIEKVNAVNELLK